MNQGRFYHGLVHLFGPVVKGLFWVRYENVENIPQTGRLIVCCNHLSVFDPILLAVPFQRQIRYMAKSELFVEHGKLFSNLLYALGAFPVRRNTGDVSSIKTAERILQDGGVVGIFPQGGCFSGGKILRLKSGAAMIAVRTQTPILPVAILGSHKPRPMHKTVMRFGQPISVKNFPLKDGFSYDIRRLTSLIRDEINELLEVPS